MSLKTRSIFWESLSASQIFSSRCPGQLKIEIIIKRSRFRFSAKSEDIYWGLTSINPSNNYKKLFLVLFLFEAIWWERVFYSANSSLFLVRKFRTLKNLNQVCKHGSATVRAPSLILKISGCRAGSGLRCRVLKLGLEIAGPGSKTPD